MKSILMIHGITDTGKVFETMTSYFQKKGYKTYTIDLIPNLGTADLRDLAQQVKEYIDNQFTPEEKIILLGFSMGGLVTRYYLQRLNGTEKVEQYINISAPNNGTNLAYFLPLKGIKQMRPDSDFLRDLNTDIKESLNKIKCLIIWTPFDMMIIPANSSLLGIGIEVSFPVLTHKWMLGDEKVFREIDQFLETS
ncbi:MAG: alpha/beta fold hydrolase [Cyanobacteria bacterium]|nr:alpha/beta fold hydrolase [Cyanobacteria bacterium CG_2015-16_32_12]NCO79508.1 alpha/beta fold hydrolase [Cyanobacteria bacterium CG_2015-22_32_23]NCQ04545.1 alpha/beta fold hydrolase [Cyanobacteria bacterium CG_2015-09_32_10]NCQ40468.1 alpha/beta fold hydrolase [Cyanobacteria bacterium CG_2015-04_32_10]NCS84552.1 alpha/beta fold hydrolase [Cyanobacteria bacterium CG_2015-02_32_10]